MPYKIFNRYKDSGLEGIMIAAAGLPVPLSDRESAKRPVSATSQGSLQGTLRNIHCGCVCGADHDSGFDRVKGDARVGLIRNVLCGLAREGHGVRPRR